MPWVVNPNVLEESVSGIKDSAQMALLTVPEGQALGCVTGHAEQNQGAAGGCRGNVLR